MNEITLHGGDPAKEGEEAQLLNPRIRNKKEKTSIYVLGFSHPSNPLIVENTESEVTFAPLHSSRGRNKNSNSVIYIIAQLIIKSLLAFRRSRY